MACIRLFRYKVVVVMNWAAYAETAQHLSEVRRREAQRRAEVAERSAGLQAALARLTARLAAQQAHQEETARGLRITVPPAVSDPALDESVAPALAEPTALALDEAVPPAPRAPLVPAPRRPETLGGATPPAGSAPAGGAAAPAGGAAAGTSGAPNGGAPVTGSRPAGSAAPPASGAVSRAESAPVGGSVAARPARRPAADPDEALRLAWEAVNRADVQTRLATERALKPLLLPEMKPSSRNALVYGAATLVAVVVQLGMIAIDSVAHLGMPTLLYLPVLLFVLPALALAAGYATLTVVGRPRIQTARPISLSGKLGCLICFLGSWAALAVSMVLLALSGH